MVIFCSGIGEYGGGQGRLQVFERAHRVKGNWPALEHKCGKIDADILW